MLDFEENLVSDIFQGFLYKLPGYVLALKYFVLYFTLLCMQDFSMFID